MTYLPFNMMSQETTSYAISTIVYYNNVTFQQIIVPYKLPKWFNVWRLIVTLEGSEVFLCICFQRAQISERFGYGIFVEMDSRLRSFPRCALIILRQINLRPMHPALA